MLTSGILAKVRPFYAFMGFAQLVVLIVFLNGINELSFVIQTDTAFFDARTEILCNTRAVRKVSSHFE